MDGLQQDLRLALRTVRRKPWFTAAIVVILGLGIGANTAIFSVVNGVLLRSLPYADAEQIVRAWTNSPTGDLQRFSFTKVEFRELFERGTSFAAVGADFPVGVTVTGAGADPQRVRAALTTPGYFHVFGATPVLGRTFTFDDIDTGSDRVVVVSNDFWSRWFAGDTGAIGRTIIVDNESFTLVGVLPDTFEHAEGNPDIFVPYSVGTDGWIGRWLGIYGRLNPGVGIEAAQAELDAILAGVSEGQPRSAGWTTTVESLYTTVVGDARQALIALVGAVTVVLLISCANVANLLLARTTIRGREIAVRMALGAGRARVAREVLVESLILSLAGGALGVGLAYAGIDALVAFAPSSIPRLDSISVSGWVLAYSLGISLAAGLLFGLAPAAHASREAVGAVLRGQSRSVTGARVGQRVLGTLVILEVALAVLLLVCAGLVVRSFEKLQRVDLGFNPVNVVAAGIALPPSTYQETAEILSFFDQLRARLVGLPDIESVAFGGDLPLSGRGAVAAVRSEAQFRAGVVERISAVQRVVTPGFFKVLGIQLVDGRGFDSRDDADTRVLVINETLARMLWPNERAVGRRVTFSREPSEDSWVEIVGVVADVRYQEIQDEPGPQLYQPHAANAWNSMFAFLETTAPSQALAAVRREVRALDRDVPVFGATELRDVVTVALSTHRFNVWAFSAFGAVALILAVGGIYSVLSFVTTRRNQELGIRAAMGARQGALMALVLRWGLGLVAAGSVLGIAGGLAGAKVLQSLLYAVSPTDGSTFAAVVAILGGAALAACYLPARRASRVDPMTVLREE